MGGVVVGGGWRVVFLSAVLFGSAALAEKDVAKGEEHVAEDAQGVQSDGAPKIKVFGRVLALMETEEQHQFERQLSIDQARLGVEAAIPNAMAVVSGDIASKSLLKDAFVRVHDTAQRFRGYAGQFKAPFLARELESTWDLPRVGRGLVDDYLVETSKLGGRRLGAMAEVKPGFMGFKAALGVFQGAVDSAGQRTSEDASARLSFKPVKALTLGASTYLGEVLKGTRRFGAATDATLRLFGASLSAEGVLGRLALGDFQGGIAALRYDFVFGETGKWLVQPVADAELLRLVPVDGGSVGRAWSLGGGVNVAYADRVKVQLQYERAFRPGEERPGNGFTAQVGARF